MITHYCSPWKVPYEFFYKKPPTYLDLKVFGFLCFASILVNNRNKFDPRSKKCIFLGYKTGIKGYTLLNIKVNKIFVVIFYENVFPYRDANTQNIFDTTDQNYSSFPFGYFEYVYNKNESHNSDDNNIFGSSTNENLDIIATNHDNNEEEDTKTATLENTQEDYQNQRHYRRSRRATKYLNDYFHHVKYSYICKDNSIINRNILKTPYPISSVPYDSLFEKHLRFTLTISITNEPQTYSEARQKYVLVEAMDKEIKALQDNNTWYLIDLPNGKYPLDVNGYINSSTHKREV